MRDWYERYYSAIDTSHAYAEFCRSVFGQDLGQHGFADMDQIQQLINALAIRPSDRIVDLGCGTGGITAFIVKQTKARAIGVDLIEQAAQHATSRYTNLHVGFALADMGQMCLRRGCADIVINIDSIYFHPLPQIVSEMAQILSPQGRMGILYTHRVEDAPNSDFEHRQLQPDWTPLAVELRTQCLAYTATDLTSADYEHALLKKAVLEELHDAFIAEGNEFLYDNRYGEANGALKGITNKVHARFMYIVTQPGE